MPCVVVYRNTERYFHWKPKMLMMNYRLFEYYCDTSHTIMLRLYQTYYVEVDQNLPSINYVTRNGKWVSHIIH